MELNGKTALVTGAANGLGRELAVQLQARGVALLLVDQDTAGLSAVQSQLPPSRARCFTCDLSQATERAGLIASLNETAGQIDLLVNCAGIGSHSGLNHLTIDELQQVLQINTLAPQELLTGLRKRFPQQEAGCVVNIGSVAGELCPPGMSAYAASKAALHAFSRSVAIELAGTGISCLLVILGALRDTHFTQSIRHPVQGQPGWYRRLDVTSQAAAQAIISAVQHGRTRLVYPAWYAWVLALVRLGGPLSEMAGRRAYKRMRNAAHQSPVENRKNYA